MFLCFYDVHHLSNYKKKHIRIAKDSISITKQIHDKDRAQMATFNRS